MKRETCQVRIASVQLPSACCYRSAVAVFVGWALAAFGSGAVLHAQSTASVSAVELLELEQQAFRAAAAAAQDVAVQIESFGGLERVGDELVSDGPTTGTIVGADGWIVSTLYSFRQQPASILVTLPDGRRLPARIVSRDHSRELALLKIDGVAGLPVARPSRLLERPDDLVGRWAVALGKAYDPRVASQSVGIVSATGRAYGRALQTDAKVSPINYGGPLIDLWGDVLGVLAPISPGPMVEGGDQLYDSGIGFAIPWTDILARLETLQSGTDIYPGKLGVVTTDPNEMAGPVVVEGAMPGAAAGRLGLEPGDVIVVAGGMPVRRLADLQQALGPRDAGQELPLTIWRRGQRIDLQATLTKEIPIYRRRLVGFWLRETDDGQLEISAVESGSPAEGAGLKTGDRIVGCNGVRPISAERLRRMIAVAELDQALRLAVLGPDGSQRDVSVRPIERPEALPASSGPVLDGDAGEPRVVDINLGDFPNKAYAVVPVKRVDQPLGVLIVFPEPGELEAAKTLDYWSACVRSNGWIVAVINSGNRSGWSLEEVELGMRTLGRLQKLYPIDPQRVVLGGLGIGGRVALLAAMSAPERVTGVLTIQTNLGEFAPRQMNMPMKSLDFLLVGDAAQMQASAETLRKGGYLVTIVEGSGGDTNSWQAAPIDQLQLWLAGLARY
ncbi:MAG: PDZ domain-containing protein [Planctomycetota bacterium]|nr:MAG: PDZ domain-containing protein [Planctomycetota bacterium]